VIKHVGSLNLQTIVVVLQGLDNFKLSH